MTKAELEKAVARIIDPVAYCMKPSAYGLATEREMLDRTMVGPIRAVALEKAREIVKLLKQS